MGTKARQYTIRNVSPRLDRALRERAAARGVSLNTVVVQALELGAGVGTSQARHTDLDDLFGSWVKDPAVERVLRDQRRVDPRDWE